MIDDDINANWIKKCDISFWDLLKLCYLFNITNMYKIILHRHSIINYCLNYFKIIILKVNKLTIHDGLWLGDSVNLFTLSMYNLFFLSNRLKYIFRPHKTEMYYFIQFLFGSSVYFLLSFFIFIFWK